MGRKAKSPDEAGVTFQAPRVLLDQIEQFAAEEFHIQRNDAIRDLLWRGLKYTAALEATKRDLGKATRDAWAGLPG